MLTLNLTKAAPVFALLVLTVSGAPSFAKHSDKQEPSTKLAYNAPETTSSATQAKTQSEDSKKSSDYLKKALSSYVANSSVSPY